MLRYSMCRCIFPYFLSSPHLFSIYRNRLRLECWWKYLSGATVTKATFLSTKNVLDIGGITTMYVITRRIQYMQFIITTLKHSWDKESNKKKYATTVMYSQSTKCLKITEKVSFNIASEANYIYILHFEWTKMVHFGDFLKTRSLRSNSVTRQVSNRTKIGGKCQYSNATFWVIFKQCAYFLY